MDGSLQVRGVSSCLKLCNNGAWANMRSLPPSLRYEVALLYLKQTDHHLDLAIEAYKEDERWEQEHPLESRKGKGKATEAPLKRRRGLGLSMTGQVT